MFTHIVVGRTTAITQSVGQNRGYLYYTINNINMIIT